MVLLDLLDVAFRRCLHKEDFKFEKHDLGGSGSCLNSASPSKYFVLGFKDRNLEDEYLRDLALTNRNKILVGYVVSILTYFSSWTSELYFFILGDKYGFVGAKFNNTVFSLSVCALAVFVLGLVACLLIYRNKSLPSKKVVLHVTIAVYFAFMLFTGGKLSKTIAAAPFGMNQDQPIGWVVRIVFLDAIPLLSVVFMGLTALHTLELVLAFFLIYLVIVPVVVHIGGFDAYGLLSSENIMAYADEHLNGFICDRMSSELCAFSIRWLIVTPLIMVYIVTFTVLIVSVVVEQGSRDSFINKKIIDALTKRSELALLKQKEEQEGLINSIFPPTIAKDLIDKQMATELMNEDSVGLKRVGSLQSVDEDFGRLVARMHEDVTIVFTDIVGFTSMSTNCLPYEVMNFLHLLFTGLDHLVDSDTQLWKIETIGDSMMVVAGLDVHVEKSVDLERSKSPTKSSSGMGSGANSYTLRRVLTCKRSNKYTSATSAVDFGRAALGEAAKHTMPNGKPCAIRVGIHTGDVCSGVVGSRMPRYCLFGDTVNTANRMESTGQAGRMQISEETHAVVCNDPDFEWECRGEMQVKGKGKMLTYMLVD